MSSTFFEQFKTPINADWLNDVNSLTYGISNTSDATKGAGLVGFSHATPYGAGTVGLSLKRFVSVKDAPYNAVGNGSTDDYAAFIAAIAYVGASAAGGIVYAPKSNYVSSAPIYVPDGVMIVGDGMYSGVLWNGVATKEQGTCIIGKHTGAAILSFKGATGGGAKDISVYGWPTATTPKTGICLGRSSGASAGRHMFQRVNATGYYTKSAWYSIASEENTFIMPLGNVLGGGAKYTFFASGVDDLSVDSLVTGSNWNANTITGFNFLHQATQDDCAAIRLNIRAGTSGWSFNGGFTGVTSGLRSSHVNIHLMDATGDTAASDFVFRDVGSESVSNASPPVQHYLISRDAAAVPSILNGLVIENCTPGQTLGGTSYFVYCEDSVTLNDARIDTSLSTHPSSFYSVKNSSIKLPQDNLTIRSVCQNSTLNARQIMHQGTVGSYSNNLATSPAISDFVFSGGGLNDMTVNSTTLFTGTASVFDVVVQIDTTGAPNTFRWSVNGGLTWTASNVAITGSAQTLTSGVVVKFAATTGHTMSAQWAFKCDPFSLPNYARRVNGQQLIASGFTGGIVGDDDAGVLLQLASRASTSPSFQMFGTTHANAGQMHFYSNGDFKVYNATGGANQFVIDKAGAVRSGRDNTDSSGSASFRWSVVYAGTGTINTSDKNLKQQIRVLNKAEKAVAIKCKGLIRAFKFNDAVDKKGKDARIHFGVVAQDVRDAFESEGLKAENYAILCFDEWGETPEQLEVIDEESGRIAVPYQAKIPAGNRWGVRYEELLAFIIGAI